MSLLFIVQFLMGLSALVAASRQAWAFSRDGALPFSRFFRPISQKFGYIPLRTIWGCVLVAAILGLLSLIAPAAAQALFSLAVSGNNLAWGTPIFARVVWGQKKFKPGPFYTGDRLSVPIAWVALVFLVFGTLLSMFPVEGPNPTRRSPPPPSEIWHLLSSLPCPSSTRPNPKFPEFHILTSYSTSPKQPKTWTTPSWSTLPSGSAPWPTTTLTRGNGSRGRKSRSLRTTWPRRSSKLSRRMGLTLRGWRIWWGRVAGALEVVVMLRWCEFGSFLRVGQVGYLWVGR